MHKDITAEFGNSSANIVSKIGDEIRSYAKSNHFSNLQLSRNGNYSVGITIGLSHG